MDADIWRVGGREEYRERVKEERHRWREKGSKEGKEGGRKRLQERKMDCGWSGEERRDVGWRKRLICLGVAGHLRDPLASIVGVQPATQHVLYLFFLNCWDQLVEIPLIFLMTP